MKSFMQSQKNWEKTTNVYEVAQGSKIKLVRSLSFGAIK